MIATSRRVDDLLDLDVHQRLEIDVRSDESVSKAVENVGHVDALVNNAGIIVSGPIEAVPLTRAKELFETNVFGTVRTMQAFVPLMRREKKGTVVNVSSMSGRFAIPLGGFYAATKHALEALSEALYYELRPFGVSVVLIEPGHIETSLGSNARKFGLDEPPYSELRNQTFPGTAKLVGGALPGPELVAATIADAISDPASQLRWPVGEDAAQMLRLRSALDDRRFELVLRKILALESSWTPELRS